MFKYLNNYEKDILEDSLKKKKWKKYKKKINLYTQIIRILKSIIYELTAGVVIIQKGNHKYMRQLLKTLITKATPVQELDKVKDNPSELDKKYKQIYPLKNIWRYIFKGYKSYGYMKTKKKPTIKKKLYKRVYKIHPYFN